MKKKYFGLILSLCCATSMAGCAFIPEKAVKKTVSASSATYQIPTIQELQESGVDVYSYLYPTDDSFSSDSGDSLWNLELIADESPYNNRHIASAEEPYLQPVYDLIDGTFMGKVEVVLQALPDDFYTMMSTEAEETLGTSFEEYCELMNSFFALAWCSDQEVYNMVSELDYSVVSATQLSAQELKDYKNLYITYLEENYNITSSDVEVTDGYKVFVQFNTDFSDADVDFDYEDGFNVYEVNGKWTCDIASADL